MASIIATSTTSSCLRRILVALFIVASTLTISTTAMPSLNYNAKQTWCGATITQTLSMFCKGRYLSMMDIVIKRAQNGKNARKSVFGDLRANVQTKKKTSLIF